LKKTAESIRKKLRALKTSKIEEDIATKSHFKPIIQPLQNIVDNSSMRAIKDKPRDDHVKIPFVQKDVIRNEIVTMHPECIVTSLLTPNVKITCAVYPRGR